MRLELRRATRELAVYRVCTGPDCRRQGMLLELKPQTLDGFRALTLATIEKSWGDAVPAPAREGN
jgi:hypothetical protein